MKTLRKLIERELIRYERQRKSIDGEMEKLLKVLAMIDGKPTKFLGKPRKAKVKKRKPTKFQGGRGHKLPEKIKLKIKELHKAEHTYDEIADLLQVSTTTIGRVVNAS